MSKRDSISICTSDSVNYADIDNNIAMASIVYTFKRKNSTLSACLKRKREKV